ncbi:TonB-dependent receptor [Flavisolibacter ginsengisoli]|uniref:Iron complex outermembrane recepter protein n=1 Tax=Flavisolibacter ginsengisoli DSM 18119 TaxID=1121884 RepID=A0A1M5BTW7_9BACT|nr:TonB-dependent receptor [Flavisolibacter ginsengisoli]SHF45885.1 iron complex outermembrane recepter protein [Flavisolibacter ginsengisoli DSM 18119]
MIQLSDFLLHRGNQFLLPGHKRKGPKKHFFILHLFLLVSFCSQAQNSVKIIVKTEDNKLPLASASVFIPQLKKGTMTDSSGSAVLTNLPIGKVQIEVSFIGYTTIEKMIAVPSAKEVEIMLEEADEEDNPNIIITATRTDRSIRNTPTRVEVIAGGEISENISMRPGEIKMLLNETTGIITQQTSAISNTADLRIQELAGRYTQILRDGFPLYSGMSEGLSLVQIAPLDLRQVEIIKGSSSTLYGGGAIAGLVNLVSKTPTEKRDLSFLANATSGGGLDLSSFFGQRFKKFGLTIFSSRNTNQPYDPSGIGFTAIPKFARYTLTPRLFYYGNKTNVNAGISYITEDRLGGNMDFVKNGRAGYYEKNNSDRFTTQLGVIHRFNDHTSLNIRNSYNHFKRISSNPSYQFDGLQQSSFSEISINAGKEQLQWVGGLNLYTDKFNETLHSSHPLRNYHHSTVGGFLQSTWSPAGVFSLEAGIREDHNSQYGSVLLPRVAALFHFSNSFSSRIGGGLGYKLPTLFTEETEERQYQDVLPIDEDRASYEKSAGANIDFTYTTSIDEVRLMINPLFFYTRINHPLVLIPTGTQFQLVNAGGFTDSKGMDVSFRLSLDKIKFYSGYSYTIAQNHFNGQTTVYPLAPRHKLHFDLVYEIENSLRVAFETYYTGPQQLSDDTKGRSYWLTGALIEKSWKHFSLFINGEDLNNVKQTDWGAIYNGPGTNPTFSDIYAPLEGRTINGGIKIML